MICKGCKDTVNIINKNNKMKKLVIDVQNILLEHFNVPDEALTKLVLLIDSPETEKLINNK